jgi:hypothetical protein
VLSNFLLGLAFENVLVLPCEVDIFGEPEIIKIAFCQACTAFENKVLMEELDFRKVMEHLVQDEVFLYQISSLDVLNFGYFVHKVFSHSITKSAISWTVFG